MRATNIIVAAQKCVRVALLASCISALTACSSFHLGAMTYCPHGHFCAATSSPAGQAAAAPAAPASAAR